MLARLTARDFVVAKALEVEFGSGLTVVTGESGAGKSLLLQALGLALGARASAGLIRPGAPHVEVAAEFAVPPGGAAARMLEELGLADEEEPERCVTRRRAPRRGASRAFVNDSPVSRRALAALGAVLLDLHAQDEGARLAQRDVQRGLFDDYAVPAPEQAAMRAAWRAWRRAIERREEAGAAGGMGGAERAELQRYQLNELDELNPRVGEYAEIDAEHVRLSQLDRFREAAYGALNELEDSDSLRGSARRLEEAGDDDAALSAARQSLDAALSLVDEAVADLRRYAERLEPDPERLAALDDRLAYMHRLAAKHRVEPAELPAVRAALADAVDAWEGLGERRAALEAEARARDAEYRECAETVGRRRRAAAEPFADAVGRCMRTLGVRDGQLEIILTSAETEFGLESVEFALRTRPDHPPGPLAGVASGGERSRIALAISMVAAERSELPCLVLDEADIGVGGVTADTVGRMLRGLANRAQVICVTHAPQVAALGDHHLWVSRGEGGDPSIRALDGAERVEEVARMLSGASVTDRARDHARDLLAARRAS